MIFVLFCCTAASLSLFSKYQLFLSFLLPNFVHRDFPGVLWSETCFFTVGKEENDRTAVLKLILKHLFHMSNQTYSTNPRSCQLYYTRVRKYGQKVYILKIYTGNEQLLIEYHCALRHYQVYNILLQKLCTIKQNCLNIRQLHHYCFFITCNSTGEGNNLSLAFKGLFQKNFHRVFGYSKQDSFQEPIFEGI